MHDFHARQLRILIALAFVWTIGCVHWYVCGIKGFCPAPGVQVNDAD
jgi:hypothetical protein